MHLYCVFCSTNSNTQVHIISPHVNIVQSKYIISGRKKRGSVYSQFFQIREVLEYKCWKLSDVVHAQVTVETEKRKNISQ